MTRLQRDGPNTLALISCVGAATVMSALVHVGMRRAFYNAETLRFEARVKDSPLARVRIPRALLARLLGEGVRVSGNLSRERD